MQSIELEEFFGAKVFIQLREAVALCSSEGKSEAFVPFSASGQPHWMPLPSVPGAARPGTKQQLIATPLAEPTFTLTLWGRIMPASVGRVFVLYESQGYVMQMALRPKDILAVTLAAQPIEPSESKLIATH